jgi:dihydrodipicolinate synthase/N-acetylneuraminate lyase
VLLPEGLIPCSYSPFTKDGKLDAKVLEARLESVLEGSSGLHGPANHSEMCALTFDEWKLWIDVMVSVAKKAKIKTWAFFFLRNREF